MGEQMSMFDGLVEPGTWLETHGRELTFDEIVQRGGKLVVMDMSTESHEWFKAVRIERIVYQNGEYTLFYYDGTRQRGAVRERYFAPKYKGSGRPARVYEMPEGAYLGNAEV